MEAFDYLSMDIEDWVQ